LPTCLNNPATEGDFVAAWIASQTLPALSLDALANGPVEVGPTRLRRRWGPDSANDALPCPHSQLFISLLTTTISSVFERGNLFATLPVSVSPDGPAPVPLRWQIPSASHTKLQTVATSPPFTSLALLSRALARSIEAAAQLASNASDPDVGASAVSVIDHSLGSLLRLCRSVRNGWAATAWSDLSAETEVVCNPQEDAALPWTALKSLLFGVVLVLSSVLVVASPKRGNAPSRKQVNLAEEGLVILSETYFVAAKFGPDGFGAWRGVWKGLMEVIKAGEEGEGERLMARVEPDKIVGVEERVVGRSVVTFYLNLAEQLVPVLGDAHIQIKVLQLCRAYLSSAVYRDTFESAHSVVLALFAAQKACALELVPWYTTLLLELAHDEKAMTAPQLRLAFTTMIRFASATDDALAWHAILQLVTALKQLPTSPQSTPTGPASPSPPAANVPDAPRVFADGTRLDEAAPSSESEDVVLSLPRGKLLLTLVDQASACSLFLLEGVLEQVWECVREEGCAEGREALGRVVFGVLSEGLSKEKRGEGVTFWMERGDQLVR